MKNNHIELINLELKIFEYLKKIKNCVDETYDCIYDDENNYELLEKIEYIPLLIQKIEECYYKIFNEYIT